VRPPSSKSAAAWCLVAAAGGVAAGPLAAAPIWRTADRSWFADAPGCAPKLYDDFIDNGPWSSRRLLPRDCRLLDERTPLFSWAEPTDRDRRHPWTLTLRDASGSAIATRQTRVPRLMLDEPLKAGAYTWNVTYTQRTGPLRTSSARQFAIAVEARDAAIPNATTFVQQVGQKARPRLLPVGASFLAIGVAARTGEYQVAYRTLLRSANEALLGPAARSPDSVSRGQFADDSSFYAALQGLRNAAGKEAESLEALCYAWHFTGETRYRDAALRRLRSLASWSPTGATSEIAQHQANRNVYVALATGTDLLWSSLADLDRQQIGQALRARLGPIVAKFASLDAMPYDSHLQSTIGYTTTALALAVGLPDFPEAELWLEQAWELHATQNYPWGEESGGMANGTAYSWYGLVNFSRSMAELRAISGVDLMARGYARRLGDFLMSTTPTPNRVPGVFGDETEVDYLYQAYSGDAYRLYAQMSRQPQHAWYWKQNPANVSSTQYLSPVHFLIGVSTDKAAAPEVPTRTNWVFEDVGQAAFHSDATSPYRSSLFFKSSRFGAWNHSHADQNSFVFHVSGAPLLVSGGYYPFYGSPHHKAVGRATRYKNALTFDGGIGQSEASSRPATPTAPEFAMDARGAIIAAGGNDRVALATGDATLAYRGRDASSQRWVPLLDDAIRSVAYARREKVVVVYDWARSAAPRKWELNYHAFASFAQHLSGTVRVEYRGASVCISHHGPAGGFDQRADFDIAPERPRPQQHHGRFTVASPSTELAVITVIRENCRDMPLDVVFVGTEATVRIGSEALRFNQRAAQWRE
jgi:Domain of unknown function (DUF4962)/Heparinase II/III-like protein